VTITKALYKILILSAVLIAWHEEWLLACNNCGGGRYPTINYAI